MDISKLVISSLFLACAMGALTEESSSKPLLKCQRTCTRMYTDCSVYDQAINDCMHFQRRCQALCNLFFNELYYFKNYDTLQLKKRHVLIK